MKHRKITGRFTSVDPLFEAFKRWSPYSYSYNSPLTFRDPTGLAPEKEKYLYDMKEVYAIMIENEVRRYFGYPQRKSTHYDAPLSNEILKPYWRK